MKKPNEILVHENSLLNTIVSEKRIFLNDENILCIQINFTNFSKESDYENIKLLFTDVKEYSFYHNNNYIFYNVENFKFLKLKIGYYLSLDPDDSTDDYSQDDMDYIISSNVEIK